MNHTTTLYGACEDLFARYPLAVKPVSSDGTVRSMVIMLATHGEPQFFILTHQDREVDPASHFSLWAWRTSNRIEIEPGTATIPGEFEDVLLSGVPLPEDGSLFGWVDGGVVTVLVPIYTQYTPETPEPSWAAMPLAEASSSQWPPFTGENLFGGWFWDYIASGQIVPLASLIASTPGEIFWLPMTGASAGCIAVAHDISSGDGWTLPAGTFVYYKDLQDGVAVPDLDATPEPTDLAPRFERMAA